MPSCVLASCCTYVEHLMSTTCKVYGTTMYRSAVVGAAGFAALLVVVLTGTPIGRNSPLRVPLENNAGPLRRRLAEHECKRCQYVCKHLSAIQVVSTGRKHDMKMHAARSIQAIRCAEHAIAALPHGRVTSCASKLRVFHASPWVGQLRS